MFFATCTCAKRVFGTPAQLLILLGWLLTAPPAMADLMLHPTRLVLEKSQRAAQVDLINDSADSATYRISLVNRRMTETGDFVAVTEAGAGEQFADNMLI